MRGNPTTGYTWNVDDAATNGAFTVATQYISDTQKHQVDIPLMGAGGTYYFTLEATRDGPSEGTFTV